MHVGNFWQNMLFTKRGLFLYILVLMGVWSLGIILGGCAYILYQFLVMW